MGVGVRLSPRAFSSSSCWSAGRWTARGSETCAPPTYDRAKPAPLVLALHGGGGSGKRFDQSTGGEITRAAARRGWVIAFPEGVDKGWNDGRTIRTRRDRSRKTHNIDRTRVYALGISNGGFMSYRLGIELGSKIAAIAPVTANLQVVHEACVPTHPMPVLIINGTKDPLVPYAGGQVSFDFFASQHRVLRASTTPSVPPSVVPSGR